MKQWSKNLLNREIAAEQKRLTVGGKHDKPLIDIKSILTPSPTIPEPIYSPNPFS